DASSVNRTPRDPRHIVGPIAVVRRPQSRPPNQQCGQAHGKGDEADDEMVVPQRDQRRQAECAPEDHAQRLDGLTAGYLEPQREPTPDCGKTYDEGCVRGSCDPRERGCDRSHDGLRKVELAVDGLHIVPYSGVGYAGVRQFLVPRGTRRECGPCGFYWACA